MFTNSGWTAIDFFACHKDGKELLLHQLLAKTFPSLPWKLRMPQVIKSFTFLEIGCVILKRPRFMQNALPLREAIDLM